MELDPFRGVAVFVVAAEAKSFRRAAIELGVSAAAVSKAILKLEDELGVPLFVRGARAVSLTRDGEAFLAHTRPAVLAVRSGRTLMESGRKQPEGVLVVSAPFVVAPLVTAAIALLRERHPRLTFSLRVTDRIARIGEEGVDVAVRVGALEDASLAARKLRGTKLYTVASPDYLARASVPRTVDALDAHTCISSLGPRGKPYAWLFASGPRVVRSVLEVDHGPSVLSAAIAGVGLGQVLDFMAEQHLADQTLVRVLADQTASGPDVLAVFAAGRAASPRVRVAVDALREALA
jgi:LysR family transcriptional regulator for bpeEF and oprC